MTALDETGVELARIRGAETLCRKAISLATEYRIWCNG